VSKPKIVLIGSGGHARSCIDVVEQVNEYKIHGLVGLADEVGHELMGYPVLSDDSGLQELRAECNLALITVGHIGSAALRIRLFEQAESLGFVLPTIISPKAYVSRHAELGMGTVVMHGAVVNAGSRLGKNCIVNSMALIEHDVSVGDHCHVSTGSILNGGCSLGDGGFVGSRSALKEEVTLGANCLVGMGVVIRHDHPAESRILRSD
jgi:sugar O-acyltransferase (sialic acid O-acetyltransferase NeuD family)